MEVQEIQLRTAITLGDGGDRLEIAWRWREDRVGNQ